MAEQVQKVKSKSVQKREEVQAEEAKAIDAQRLKDEADAMLDEIDALLEENAEDFVKGYVQKGGE